MTVRQVFYQATVRGLVPKTEAGYGSVQYQLLAMRRGEELPWTWIVDNTRWMRKPATYSSLSDMLDRQAEFYRRSVWDTQAAYVEVWCEKDALAGVIGVETEEYDVPLMVSRGFSSESFLWSAAQAIKWRDKPAYIYLASDFDGSGLDLARAIETRLTEFVGGEVPVFFERLAVTPDQIVAWDLPTRPPKDKDKHRPEFRNGCCELDAIPPRLLRRLVRDAIESHIDQDELAAVMTSERVQRETLVNIAETFRGFRGWRPSHA